MQYRREFVDCLTDYFRFLLGFTEPSETEELITLVEPKVKTPLELREDRVNATTVSACLNSYGPEAIGVYVPDLTWNRLIQELSRLCITQFKPKLDFEMNASHAYIPEHKLLVDFFAGGEIPETPGERHIPTNMEPAEFEAKAAKYLLELMSQVYHQAFGQP